LVERPDIALSGCHETRIPVHGNLRDHAVRRGLNHADQAFLGTRAEHLSGRRHARLQAEQLDHNARLERELANLSLIECVSDGGVHCVESHHIGFHADGLADGGDLRRHVQGRWRVYLKLDSLLGEDREAGLFNTTVYVPGGTCAN
jgi:hypothetical protein